MRNSTQDRPDSVGSTPRPALRWARAIATLTLIVFAFTATLASTASTASAGTSHVFHIAPSGTKGATGASWKTAGALSDLSRFVRLAEPGDQVWIRGDAGAYRTSGAIVIDAGGSATSPVVVRGVAADGSDRARPTFIGTRTAPYRPNGNPGTELFKLRAGASHLEFRNMSFVNQGNGVFRVGAPISNLRISNMSAKNVRRFFESNPSDASSATVSGLNISNVTVRGFSRGVIRLQDNTNNVTIQNVIGDSERQNGDPFAMGVHLDDTVHNVLLKRVTMRNSHDTVSGPYWNGDGFTAEGTTYNLRFVDTVATGSTDAGYDLKGDSITLVRAIAEGNKRNFRFHGQADMIDCVGRNPHRRGGDGSQAQVWAGNDARVRITNGTFTDKSSSTFVFAVEETANMTIKNVKVKKARAAREAVVEKHARLRRL